MRIIIAAPVILLLLATCLSSKVKAIEDAQDRNGACMLLRLVNLKGDTVRENDLIIIQVDAVRWRAFFREFAGEFNHEVDVKNLTISKADAEKVDYDYALYTERGFSGGISGDQNSLKRLLQEEGLGDLFTKAFKSLKLGKGEWFSSALEERSRDAAGPSLDNPESNAQAGAQEVARPPMEKEEPKK